MSGIELKPISDSNFGRSNFLLPLGKTIIGRGPVLGVSDKRVSRNHGVVEVEDGKVKIMSTHTNPTFYQAKGTSKLVPLAKEVWQFLEHGDRISLTPDQHVYEVVIDERPYNKSSQSLGTSLTDSPVKQSPQKRQRQTANEEEDKEHRENNRNEDNKTGADEKIQSNNVDSETNRSKRDEEHEEEKQDETKDEADSAEREFDAQSPVTQSKAGTVVLQGNKEMALPLDRQRKLPAWMANLAAGSTTVKEKPVAKEAARGKGRGRPRGASTTTTPRTTTSKRSKKPPSVSDEASDEDYKPAVKKTPSRGRGRPKGRGRGKGTGGPGRPRTSSRRVVDDDEEEEEEEEENFSGDDDFEEAKEERPKKWGHGKTRDQAAVKRKAKVALDYSEDFIASDEEDEEEIPVPEEDDGSDWEPESHSPRLTRTPSKGKRTPGRTSGRTSGRKRTGGRKFSRRSSDDEDSDLSEEEVYIPRPTKRSGRSVSSSQEIESSQDKPRKRAKKTDNGKKREACQYGKKCYRKNPLHLEEFAHPGDSDYRTLGSEDDEEEEKEECPYGTDCYRKNKQHLKQYQHTKAPGRPKRQAARKKASVVDDASDDDGEVNTYDYDDSFIDDGTQDTGKNSGSDSEDWTPGARDDDD